MKTKVQIKLDLRFKVMEDFLKKTRIVRNELYFSPLDVFRSAHKPHLKDLIKEDLWYI